MTSASQAAAEAPAREATVPQNNALLRQLVGQESAIDRAVLDEKNANGVRLASGGEKRGRSCLQGHDILFKGGRLNYPPRKCVGIRNWEGEHTEAPGEQAVVCRYH
jgi:hypothetical protein